MGWFKRTVRRWLRLPPDPRPPAGSEESVQVFHAAPNYYRYALARWGLRQAGAIIGLLFVLGFWLPLEGVLDLEMSAEKVEEIKDEVTVARWAERRKFVEVRSLGGDPEQVEVSFGPAMFWGEMFGIAVILLQMPFTYTLVRLDYELRWYIVTDCSLRIREGITAVRETTLTFGNIQNLAIRQGPIQRLLGIADLRVRTAGGGSGGEDHSSDESKKDSMHIAYLRGVDNAPALRDAILAHLQRLKTSGLGEAAPSPAVPVAASALEAARDVLREAQTLRAAIR